MLSLSSITNLLGNKIDPAIMALAMKHLNQQPIELPDIRNIIPPERVQAEIEKLVNRTYRILHEWQEKRRVETEQPTLYILPQIIVSDKGFLQLELREVASGSATTYARIPLNGYFIKVMGFIYKNADSFEDAKLQTMDLVKKKYVLV